MARADQFSFDLHSTTGGGGMTNNVDLRRLARLIATHVFPVDGHRSGPTARAPFALFTDVGLVRSENQDRVAALFVPATSERERSFFCFALVDGMGGMIDGRTCAVITVSTFFASLLLSNGNDHAERLRRAALAANDEVYDFAGGRGGATLSAALLDSAGQLQTINIGDSRIYTAEETRNELRRATVDDTLEERFGGQGRDLLQFIGLGRALQPTLSDLPQDVEDVLITSDGVHYVGDDLMSRINATARNSNRSAERLLALARWLGGPDNASIVAFQRSAVSQALDTAQGGDPILWTVNGPTSILVVRISAPRPRRAIGKPGAKGATIRNDSAAQSSPAISQPNVNPTKPPG